MKNRVLAFIFTTVLLIGVGAVDYVTTNQITVAGLYFIPIAYAAWQLGWAWSFAMGSACAGVIGWVELQTGFHPEQTWIVGERLGMRLFVFGFVAYSFNFFKRTIDRERKKVRELEAILAVCNGCGKVRDGDGNWVSVRQFLAEAEGEQQAPKLCPDCSRSIASKLVSGP